MSVGQDHSWLLSGYRWDLRYTASALRALQMTHRSLEQLAAGIMAHSVGAGMSDDTQALLVWAGQKRADPKLKLRRVKLMLQQMDLKARQLLITWAAAGFCTAYLEIAGARIAQTHPEPGVEDGDDL